ncbi:MAG: flagellar biosynthetic protein FliR [Caldisericaceae bacterium]|nr:flagellar biosynthetic protein FliR [Caldisericaceae bacterium]
MFTFIDKISQLTPLYLLVFSRISAMLVTMPLFSFGAINVRVRVLLAFILTLIITPLLSQQMTYMPVHWLQLVLDVLREVLVGLMVGYGAQIIFEAIMIAGTYVGFQLGLAIMNVIDPTSQENMPIVGNFWVMVVLMFFIITNSHYFLVETLFFNFKIIKPSTAVFHAAAGQAVIETGKMMFDLAIRFAAPVMVFILLFDVAISFMARVMPQMNIFFVSLPLKIAFGIFLLIVSLNIFQGLFAYIIDQMQGMVGQIIRGI